MIFHDRKQNTYYVQKNKKIIQAYDVRDLLSYYVL